MRTRILIVAIAMALALIVQAQAAPKGRGNKNADKPTKRERSDKANQGKPDEEHRDVPDEDGETDGLAGQPDKDHRGPPGDRSDGGKTDGSEKDDLNAVSVLGIVRSVRHDDKDNLVSFMLTAKDDEGEPYTLRIRVTDATKYRLGGKEADASIIKRKAVVIVKLRAEPEDGKAQAVSVTVKTDEAEKPEQEKPDETEGK